MKSPAIRALFGFLADFGRALEAVPRVEATIGGAKNPTLLAFDVMVAAAEREIDALEKRVADAPTEPGTSKRRHAWTGITDERIASSSTSELAREILALAGATLPIADNGDRLYTIVRVAREIRARGEKYDAVLKATHDRELEVIEQREELRVRLNAAECAATTIGAELARVKEERASLRRELEALRAGEPMCAGDPAAHERLEETIVELRGALARARKTPKKLRRLARAARLYERATAEWLAVNNAETEDAVDAANCVLADRALEYARAHAATATASAPLSSTECRTCGHRVDEHPFSGACGTCACVEFVADVAAAANDVTASSSPVALEGFVLAHRHECPTGGSRCRGCPDCRWPIVQIGPEEKTQHADGSRPLARVDTKTAEGERARSVATRADCTEEQGPIAADFAPGWPLRAVRAAESRARRRRARDAEIARFRAGPELPPPAPEHSGASVAATEEHESTCDSAEESPASADPSRPGGID